MQTALQAAGAEHLIIANLLIRGVQAFRAQANQPGYDIVAVAPSQGRSIRIQVKSRAATDAGGWKVSNWDFDLLALVRLNLGEHDGLTLFMPGAMLEPEIYLVSPDDIPDLRERGSVKFTRSALPQKSLNNWPAVEDAFHRAANRSNEGFSLDEHGRRRDDFLLSEDDR